MEEALAGRFDRAWNKVSNFLAQHGVKLSSYRLQVNEDLGQASLAMFRSPDTIVVTSHVPESVLAHELVHAAQGTLDVFRGFQRLYSVLSEGLTEFVAKSLYQEHRIKYLTPYRLISLLYQADRGIVRKIVELDNLTLAPGDIDRLLKSRNVHSSFKALIRVERRFLKENIKRAIQSKIEDPTFISLGEDLRAWKFILSLEFDPVRERINALMNEYFGQERKKGD